MKVFLTLVLLFCSTLSKSQTKDTLNSPCKDKLYIELQKKNLDSLSQREYEYFMIKVKECSEFIKLKEKLQTQKEIEAEPSNAGSIVAICIAGVVVLTLLGVILNNSKK